MVASVRTKESTHGIKTHPGDCSLAGRSWRGYLRRRQAILNMPNPDRDPISRDASLPDQG
jgi:hypothetical protein